MSQKETKKATLLMKPFPTAVQTFCKQQRRLRTQLRPSARDEARQNLHVVRDATSEGSLLACLDMTPLAPTYTRADDGEVNKEIWR